jgi:hypothetical protein
MTPARFRAPSLSGEQLSELLGLLEGADSAELKLTVPESDERSAVQSLQLDPSDAQMRQVVFFDTPELTLNERGLVVRARRVQRRGDDSVIKLRPVVPGELPPALRRSPSFDVEVHAMPRGFVCSGSLKAACQGSRVKEVLAGDRSVRKLFTNEQRAFFTDHAPEGQSLDGLVPLGPINVLELKFAPEVYGLRLIAELWFYPDGSRILELSTRCPSAKAFKVAAEAKAFLTERGVDLSGEQQTKTHTTLEYFARLAGNRPSSRAT